MAPQVVQLWFAHVPLQHSEYDWQASPPALQLPPEVVPVVVDIVEPVVAAPVPVWAPTPVDTVTPKLPPTPAVNGFGCEPQAAAPAPIATKESNKNARRFTISPRRGTGARENAAAP